MATIPEALAIAIQHHQGGRLQAAEQIYRQILQTEPDHPEALHLLGVIAHQTGKHEAAVEYIRRAIGLKGNDAEFHYNLAKVYQALNRMPEAIIGYRRALELEPGFAEAHNNLGNAVKELGRLDEAIACFCRALELKPDYAAARNNLGIALKDQGKLDEAIACYRRAVALRPDFAEAHNNLGLALKDQGKPEEAVVCGRRALELKPDDAELHNNLGLAFYDQGKLEDAVACFRRALELKPDFAWAHLNLGAASDADEAAACFRRALDLAPDFAEAHNNVGNTLRDEGKLEEAALSFRRATELKPEYADARLNLAVALFLLGCYEEAWAQYESRLAPGSAGDFSAPRWNREPAGGRTILLHAEQGFGDTLCFVRYACLVRERAGAGRVILECQPQLARLLAQSALGAVEIVARGLPNETALPRFDWHLPLLSAPLALGIFEPLALSEAYLRADPGLRAVWRDRLGASAGFRVGLAWKGNPAHERDRMRSIAWDQFSSLLRIGGVRFYSLQIGAGANEIAALSAAGAVDLTPRIVDFADTAALASELDLIISVDTALAHLAGALGLPVWTLLPFVPDWRWGREGESTPWYPTMRLFRQPKRDDWDSVLRRIGEELEAESCASDAGRKLRLETARLSPV